MSPLEEMLVVLDDAALSALASPGLLRRAKAVHEKGAGLEIVEATPGRVVLEVEEHVVRLDKDGLAKARCDCPATGICRHVLTAALHLRQLVLEAKEGQEQPKETLGKAQRDAPGNALENRRRTISARVEIAALPLEVIKTFAGTDWPEALRIAALSGGATPQDSETSVVVLPGGAPGPVTFIGGGGLRKALFKGPDGRRKRFVAAAALLLGGHDLPAVEPRGARVETALLNHAAAAVLSGLHHGLKGDPALAQDRLFDVAVSLRADAAPRLAVLLHTAAHHAGRLAMHAPEGDPLVYLQELATCFALIRALRQAPDDPLLTGQFRRDYQPAAPRDLAVLGISKWRMQAGTRGLTIHGWDGKRYLSTGPARAAGIDPTFSLGEAYVKPWWPGLAPARMPGLVFHLPEPRLSPDGLLPGNTRTGSDPQPFELEALPFHDNWQALRAEVVERTGLGLRAATRPLPLLVRGFSAAPPRFDEIDQRHLIDIYDQKDRALTLVLPDALAGTMIFEKQRGLQGVLIEALADGDGPSFRLISLYYGDPLQIWDVTAGPMPEVFSAGGTTDRLRGRLRKTFSSVPPPGRPVAVAVFADETLRALCDAARVASSATLRDLSRKADTLGLTDLARSLETLCPDDSEAVLCLGWKTLLVRQAAMWRQQLP